MFMATEPQLRAKRPELSFGKEPVMKISARNFLEGTSKSSQRRNHRACRDRNQSGIVTASITNESVEELGSPRARRRTPSLNLPT